MMQALGYTIFLRYLFGGIFALFLASVAMPSQPAQADFIYLAAITTLLRIAKPGG